MTSVTALRHDGDWTVDDLHALDEDSGVSAMWVVDLDETSITGWLLRDGCWSDEPKAVGDQTFAAELPFPVAVEPRSLRPSSCS